MFYVPVKVGLLSGSEAPGALTLSADDTVLLVVSDAYARGYASPIESVPPGAVLYLKQVYTVREALYDDAAEAAANLMILAKIQGYQICDSSNC